MQHSQSDPTILFSLPSELLALVLSHLTFPALLSSFLANSTFLAVYNQWPEHISRAIVIRTGLADFRTSGAAASLRDGAKWAQKEFHDELDGNELKEVIRAQGSMFAFDGIQDWQNYARARFAADQNWRHGRSERRLIRLDVEGDRTRRAPGLIWRFKLDTDAKMIVATGLAGGCFAYTLTGEIAWSCQVPFDPYSHIELSDGYITVSLNNAFVILRRSDLPPATHPSSRSLPAALSRIQQTYPGHSIGYNLDEVVTTPQTCTATKLRYPYLLASTNNASEVNRYNVETHQLCTNSLSTFAAVDELDELQVRYVEIDNRSLYIAGQHSFSLWQDLPFEHTPLTIDFTPATPSYRTWPPAPPLTRETQLNANHHYRDQTKHPQWTAIHHDARDKHLVGISARGSEDGRAKLMWTVDFQKAIWGDDPAVIEQKTVVLVTDHADLVQLAVENDRVVFVAWTEKLGCSLWLLNLREFEDQTDFARALPKPICLAWPLPLLDPPSRVEITSTEIFLPCLSAFLTPISPSDLDSNDDSTPQPEEDLDALFRTCGETLPQGKWPFGFRWEGLSGEVWWDCQKEESGHEAGQEVVSWEHPIEMSDAGSEPEFEGREEEEEQGEAGGEEEVEAPGTQAANDRLQRYYAKLRTNQTELGRMEWAWLRCVEKAEQEEGLPQNGGTDALWAFCFETTEGRKKAEIGERDEVAKMGD